LLLSEWLVEVMHGHEWSAPSLHNQSAILSQHFIVRSCEFQM